MYLISVIIPVFNTEEIMEKCFNSLLNQTIGFENLEIIFVDDASTDNTKEIIHEYKKKYYNVKYFYLDENSGNAGKPRNIGLKYALSNYIMFLDADDEYLPNACEVLYKKITEENADFVSGNFIQIKNNVKIDKSWDILNLSDNELVIDDIVKNQEVLALPPAIWTKIFKRSFISGHSLKFLEYKPAEDLYFFYQSLLLSNLTVFINIPILYYRERDKDSSQQAISNDNSKVRLEGYLFTYKKAFELLKEFNPSLVWPLANHLNYWSNLFLSSQLSKEDSKSLIMNYLELLEFFNEYNRNISGNFGMYCRSQLNGLKTLINYILY